MVDALVATIVIMAILVAVVFAIAWYLSQLAWVSANYAVVVRKKRGDGRIVRVVLVEPVPRVNRVRRNPLTERYELLSLDHRTMEVAVPGAATMLEGREVRFTLHLVVQYQPVADPAHLERMADQLLMGERAGLEARLRGVVGANAREVCRRLTPLQLNSDRDGVSRLILDSANEALRADGLRLRVVIIKDFDDDEGFFERRRREHGVGPLRPGQDRGDGAVPPA